jgi:O-antigen ligase
MSSVPVSAPLREKPVGLIPAAVAAVALPTLIAFNLPPSSTFLNQAVSLAGWGLLVVVLAFLVRRPEVHWRSGLGALLAALAWLCAAAFASTFLNELPSSLALSAGGAIAAAAVAALAGAAASQSERAEAIFRAFCFGLVLAGVASTGIAVIQVFAPDLADGSVIAASAFPGRGSGNLRQPNHLSSLLLWALIAVAWLWQSGKLNQVAAAIVAAALVFGVVLTASRTGVVGIVLLCLWGLLDRRLPRGLRIALVMAPVVYAVFWLGMLGWARMTQMVFGGEARVTTEGDISSSRFAIWSDTIALIRQNPWTGVGFGEFNFAWSLTPFPDRPTAFFDHTHNLPLHLIVEMGVIQGACVLLLLTVALWRAFVTGADASSPRAAMLRASFMLVVMIGIHSLLEYPLWYAYFLLPTAFAFGFCLGTDKPAQSATALSPPRPNGQKVSWAFLVSGLILIVTSAAGVVDYWRVSTIFSAQETTPLESRIASGLHSPLFAHHAAYAAVTSTATPWQQMESFDVASHYLLDTRLMMAWAKAFAEKGELERARHIAQRLREFRNEDANDFFAPCDGPVADPAPPFQCSAPSTAMDFRVFR